MRFLRAGMVVLLGLSASLVGASAAASVPAGSTAVTMRVTGCEGCRIVPMTVLQKEPGGKVTYRWTGHSGTVKNGRVRFIVPTRATAGMSFELYAPWTKGAMAQPLIAMSDGIPSPYDPTEQVDQHCWGGVSTQSVTLIVTVKKLKGHDAAVGSYQLPVAWADSASGPKGPQGHQDLPYCTAP